MPIIGQYTLAADVLGGKPPGALFYVLAAVSVLVLAGLLVHATARLLSKETIVFGR